MPVIPGVGGDPSKVRLARDSRRTNSSSRLVPDAGGRAGLTPRIVMRKTIPPSAGADPDHLASSRAQSRERILALRKSPVVFILVDRPSSRVVSEDVAHPPGRW